MCYRLIETLAKDETVVLVVMKNNIQSSKNGFEFNQVINHEGKVYLALELMVSKTIEPADILRKSLSVDMLIKAYQTRLDRCMERLQWAIGNNRIVSIKGCDNSHIYYESSKDVADACFKVQLSSYSLRAADMMKEAITKLKACVKSYVDGGWISDNLTSLQIQQLIKAFEEISLACPEVRENIVGHNNILDILDYLHECYVVSWQKEIYDKK